MPQDIEKNGGPDETEQIETPKEGKVGNNGPEKMAGSTGVREDMRDENEDSRRSKGDHRDSSSTDQKRAVAKPSPSRKSRTSGTSVSSSPQRSYMHDGYQPYPPSGRGSYHPPHGVHGGPRGPPPSSAPYPHPPLPYYGGAPHDPYRGPPPPHYHQMPPLPHPGQYGGPGAHYGPPPNMAGRPGPPPNYLPPYGAPYGAPPAMGYHGGPPPPNFGPPGNPSHPMSVASDTNSISSGRSKGSRSTKSSNGASKKRTIDGVHESTEKSLSIAYSFRRANSTASSSSTVTASNNASDAHPLTEESPRKRDRSSSRSSNHMHPTALSSSNIFEEDKVHRRHPSGTSTTSSLSVGGFSLSSYDGPRSEFRHQPLVTFQICFSHIDSVAETANGEGPLMKASPKRRKGSDCAPLVVDTGVGTKVSSRNGHRRAPSPTDSAIDGRESSRFEQLSMNDPQGKQEDKGSNSLFMSLSTSPINHPEVDATPISKNTNRKNATKITIKTDVMDEDEDEPMSKGAKPSPFRKPLHARSTDTPTAPLSGSMADTEILTDEHMLNRHLRGHTFTPLPHLPDSSGVSPSNAAFSAINAQLSWSIAGDAPSLEDLATCSWEENDKEDSKRPRSTTSNTSCSTRGMVISPHNFSLWKEEHETNHPRKSEDGKDNDTVRLSMLSPHSEIAMAVEGVSGTTTPLPLFFNEHPGSEERENVNHEEKAEGKSTGFHHHSKEGETDHIHNMFVANSGRVSSTKHHNPNPLYSWSKHEGHGGPPTPLFAGSKPPTPLFAGSNVGFARSPLHGDARDHRMMFGHPPHGSHNDRVRNLRGRVPPGSHMPPMPLHIPPPMSSHHPLTSPMGIGHHGKAPMWSPHHGGMPPPMASPHHPMDMAQSKRKCVPLKPPIPSKFQGDMEKMKGAAVPEFTSLVNFPAHMSQKQSVNLPEGMRCCVMCGQACPCSTGNKKKPSAGKLKADGSLAPRSSNGQDSHMGDKNNFAIIPTQNKGLCTLCDVNVWVVVNNGLEIKWCKGCKNFRPWAAFGDKGLATKCLRCRERQREKYALQKEEKEKARLTKGSKAKG